MGKQVEQTERFTADKFCGQCGQKNFRPNRSLRELFAEFVEDWLGYDSKIYKTTAKLAKPAALSLDYFANSHHKNHYITPIRLYLLLSIVFFLMTNFGGLSLTELEFNNASNTQQSQQKLQEAEQKLQDVEQELNQAIKDAESAQEKAILETALDVVEQDSSLANEPNNQPTEQKETDKDSELKGNVSITGDGQFSNRKGCITKPDDFFNIWPKWLDRKLDSGVKELCDSFDAVLNLPESERQIAKRNWGLSIGQKAIEMVPQVFFLSLPILALVLGLFYFMSKRLYVEHLVLLMHSHSFIFSVVLLYLGWYQLTQLWPLLGAIWMEEILLIGIIVYLYLSQKWFYQRGWWATLWRFLLFGFLYFILITILTAFGIMFGVVLGAN